MRATLHTSTAVTLMSLLIAAVVGLSGTHAKDLVAAALPTALHEDAGAHFIKVDLHHHSDISVKVQPHGGDGHQVDSRSLRLLHHKRNAHKTIRFADRARLWLQVRAV